VIFDQPKEEGGEDGGMTPVELFIASKLFTTFATTTTTTTQTTN